MPTFFKEYNMKAFPTRQASREVHERIDALREFFGQDLVIVGHHYQSDDVIAHVDKVGDSLELARMIDGIEARHIVFCGVHFMAESAALLARPGQSIYLPVSDASCVMAEMTPAGLLEKVFNRVSSGGRKVLPLAYVNTSLAVKAVVGRHDGAVCTSANADKMMRWALDNGDVVFFLPDKNLGVNTADRLGLPESARALVNIRQGGELAHLPESVQLLLWPGCCAVHACFRPDLAEAARQKDPQARIIVHPECSPAMVQTSDGAGSTSYLIQEAEASAPGSVLYIGTESNLVHRLMNRHAGRVRIEPLAESTCSHMLKITAESLLHTLEGIQRGDAPVTCVDQTMAAPAKASLQRMLEQCSR